MGGSAGFLDDLFSVNFLSTSGATLGLTLDYLRLEATLITPKTPLPLF